MAGRMNGYKMMKNLHFVGAGLAAALLTVSAAAQPVEQEVRFDSEPGVSLAGTLMHPEGGPYGVIVMITGAGPHGRDQQIAGVPMFAEIAAQLAGAGWASLRIDERGVGGSTGQITPHFQARMPDVLASIDFAAGQGLGPVGLLGHSEGAMLAPLAEIERPDVVEFLILLGAPGADGRAIWVDQQLAMTRESDPDADSEKLAAVEAALHRVVDAAIAGDDAAVEAATRSLFSAWQVPDEIYHDGTFESFAARMASPEMEVFLAHDPASALALSADPRLVIFGGADYQTSPSVNLPLIEAASAEADAEFIVLEGENHFFLKAPGHGPGAFVEGEMVLSEPLGAAMADWLARREGP